MKLLLKRLKKIALFMCALLVLYLIGTFIPKQAVVFWWDSGRSLESLAAKANSTHYPVKFAQFRGNSEAYVCPGSDFKNGIDETFLYHYGADDPQNPGIILDSICGHRQTRPQTEIVLFDNACLIDPSQGSALEQVAAVYKQGCGRVGTHKLMDEYIKFMRAKSGNMKQHIRAYSISAYVLGSYEAPPGVSFILEAAGTGDDFYELSSYQSRRKTQVLEQYGAERGFSGWDDLSAKTGGVYSPEQLRQVARWRLENGFKLIDYAVADPIGFTTFMSDTLAARSVRIQKEGFPEGDRGYIMNLLFFAFHSRPTFPGCGQWIQDTTAGPWGSDPEYEAARCAWNLKLWTQAQALAPYVQYVYKFVAKTDVSSRNDWIISGKTIEQYHEWAKQTAGLPEDRRFRWVSTEGLLAEGENIHQTATLFARLPIEKVEGYVYDKEHRLLQTYRW